MICIHMDRCEHGHESLSIGDEHSSVTVTANRCCKRSRVEKTWILTPDLAREAANELQCAADKEEES